ncbi:hypothetical protein AR457_37055 [Streptomyces agglomeratus]|uniref:TauD/TfdA family dioxygenase n=1 Tax=Streptomyces agglomeratus TaxID=285458 RepID=UPI0008548571|nr:TauD/TfdA family dioxygenase [Streptomyces agglomeratus]OEJ22856.1 hypothetical protein AR457_37055 [Streptomyces agglomeratus]
MNDLALIDMRLLPGGRRAVREVLSDALRIAPYGCVLRGSGFLDVPGAQRTSWVKELTELMGSVSDSNRFDERSGVFVDEVAPVEPASKDVTFALGACEAHSDESSKIQPEDIVFLWCVRPAEHGGESLLWPVEELVEDISVQPGGTEALETLRGPDFLFGGRLRNPPRVLRGPVLFGTNGIRFRLGSLLDAQDVSGMPMSDAQASAVGQLTAAVRRVRPYRAALDAGDVLVFMNRKTLHARSDFTDRDRLLLRTRCFSPDLSNSDEDSAGWL